MHAYACTPSLKPTAASNSMRRSRSSRYIYMYRSRFIKLIPLNFGVNLIVIRKYTQLSICALDIYTCCTFGAYRLFIYICIYSYNY